VVAANLLAVLVTGMIPARSRGATAHKLLGYPPPLVIDSDCDSETSMEWKCSLSPL
jgi:hypothetical protein